jgi:hypothetical protein
MYGKHTNIFCNNTDCLTQVCAIFNLSNIEYEVLDEDITSGVIKVYYQSIPQNRKYDLLVLLIPLIKKGSLKKLDSLIKFL